jgi:hypothetical protein
MDVLIFTQGAERGLRAKVVHFVDAVLNEIGRLDFIHLELGFRTIEFGEQRFEKSIAFCGFVRRGHGDVWSGLRAVRRASCWCVQ